MDFDQQAVAARCNRGERHRGDEIAPPSAMAGVSDDGQVREPLDERDGADVHRVARHFLEGANAAFAQNNVGVALREDVFRGQLFPVR